MVARTRVVNTDKDREKKRLLKLSQEALKKEFERRAELSKTRNILGLRQESALTTPGIDDSVGGGPTGITTQAPGAPRGISAITTPAPTSALASPIDTAQADNRAKSLDQELDANKIVQKKKRAGLLSALESTTAEKKRTLTSALG